MRFCTVINCMDGRVQLPVLTHLQQRFDVDYVDTITEAGPNLILSEQKKIPVIQAILEKLRISVEIHNSVGIALVGHHDCAGNPSSHSDQIVHIERAIKFLRQHHHNMDILGLWVDENWEVHELQETLLDD